MRPRLTAESTGAEALAEVIIASGDPVLFGLPGGHTMAVFDALRDRPELAAVLVREESIATVAAETYGRLSGRPAVVMAQGAWLLGVGGAGIMEAHLAASPMVIIADTTEGRAHSHLGPYQSGFGGYGAFDLPAALRAITKRTFVATYPSQAAEVLQLAFVHATSGEPGPVAVVLHSDAILGRLGEEGLRELDLERPLTPAVFAPDPAVLDSAAAHLEQAARPVVVVGNGARRSSDALARLVTERDLPFASTPGGKGVLPEDDPRCAGVIGGFGHDLANVMVGDADVVLAVGTKLGATDTVNGDPRLLDGRRQRIIHVDVEPVNAGWTLRSAERVVGDAGDVAMELLERTGQRHDGAGRVERARGTARQLPVPAFQAADGRVNPRALASLLAEILPAETIVTCDAGENRLYMLRDYTTRAGGTFLQPNGGGAMGHAVPAALAATYALPDRLAVAVLGDGGFAMSVHSLMSAIENRRHMLVVVMDNTALGWVLHGQGDRPFMSTFEHFDLAAIATAIGATATRVDNRDAVEVAVDAALAGDGVHVVVVDVSRTESFLSVQSELAVPSHELVKPDGA